MEELIDRVDENDVVVGATTKREAHENGYPHRVAAVFVFDEDKKLLVQLRKKDGFLDHSAAGHVRLGETYDAAAVRELGEELGLYVPLEKVGVLLHGGERISALYKKPILHYFCLYETHPGKEALDAMVFSRDEVLKIIPMSLEEIAQSMLEYPMKYTTGFQCTLNFYSQQKNLTIPVVPIK